MKLIFQRNSFYITTSYYIHGHRATESSFEFKCNAFISLVDCAVHFFFQLEDLLYISIHI